MEGARPIPVSRSLVLTQAMLGFWANLLFAVPYCAGVSGLERLDAEKRHLFVSNHVSLLDTVLLGALLWRAGAYPLLVLGDLRVWHANVLRRVLSSRIGFLLERGRMNAARLDELHAFGTAARDFNLLVFPEGTRGNGTDVAECQPGVFHIAQDARVPLVPVFIAGMEHVSTKEGRFHPFSGLRKVTVHFGAPIPPETYLKLPRDAFTPYVRERIQSLCPASRLQPLEVSAA